MRFKPQNKRIETLAVGSSTEPTVSLQYAAKTSAFTHGIKHPQHQKMPNIKVISFDLDDTLWDVWSIIQEAERTLHAWLAPRYPLITQTYTPIQIRLICADIAKAHPEIAHDKSELRFRALQTVAKNTGYDPALAAPAFEVFYTARNDVTFFDDVMPVLQQLAQSYTLGALSNGNADIHQAGLGHLFDFQFNAINIGSEKPNRPMFDAVCTHTGANPNEILHVGDHAIDDIFGAQNAGFLTAWVNRKQTSWNGPAPADIEIQNLSQLIPALQTLQS